MELGQIHLIIACVCAFLMACGIGANDVSNAMGTSVGSKAITVRQAIVIAVIFEFLGSVIAGGHVTNTISHGILSPAVFTESKIVFSGMLASLLAAAAWLALATFLSLPVSTTHTIVGAVIGFGWMQIGLEAIKWSNVLGIVAGWIVSPVIGGLVGFLLFKSLQKSILYHPKPFARAKMIAPIYILLVSWVISMLVIPNFAKNLDCYLSLIEKISYSFLSSAIITLIGIVYLNKSKFDKKDDKNFFFTNVEKIFAKLMLLTSCAMAFAHGSNDVANAIGPLAAISHSVLGGTANTGTPLWILLIGALGIVVGLSLYGYRVIGTIGSGITELTPTKGFAATIAAALTVVGASNFGLPISTTHTLVGAILGIGMARGINAINKKNVRNIFLSWLITLPAGTFLAIIFYKIILLII